MKNVYQIKISLRDVKPVIWRRIQVPGEYTFWDLHVAIQDAMGWTDCHLHSFRINAKKGRKPVEIGIPEADGMSSVEIEAGWDSFIQDFIYEVGMSCEYDYDFGDGWQHIVLLEGILLPEKKEKYPRCTGGSRACPPEDCGGPFGYQELINLFKKKKGKDYIRMREWLGYELDPEAFNQDEVEFDDPGRRLDLLSEYLDY
jgi:hypothetical protein